jgi:hypothetical protein
MTIETELTAVDRDALRRALIAACRESPSEAARFEAMVSAKGWLTACETASYVCQCRSLKLKVWEAPPCHCRTDDVGSTYGRKPKEVELRQRLLANGLSLYEPDPRGALAAIEAKSADVA